MLDHYLNLCKVVRWRAVSPCSEAGDGDGWLSGGTTWEGRKADWELGQRGGGG
jgi:hypothetical protein